MSQSVQGAVQHMRVDDVHRLAAVGIGLEEPDGQKATPMIFAASSNRMIVAEILMDDGANIWAYDEVGTTAAKMIVFSRVLPDSGEGQAHARLIEKLKARGHPSPPPDSDEVLAPAREGKRPPPSQTH